MKGSYLAAIAATLLASAACAQTISVNFGGTAGLDPADQAGNPDVGAFVANWNNAPGASGASLSLIDSDGNATPVVLSSWNSPLGVWSIPNTTGGTNLSGGANPVMMKGYLDADTRGSTVVLDNLSQIFSAYKVLIYFDGDNGGQWRIGNYSISDANGQLWSGFGEDSENTNFNAGLDNAGAPIGQNPNGLFQIPVPGAGGNSPYPTSPNNSEGNFLISDVLTANSITLTAVSGPNAGTPRAPINGIQIIGVVPEPGTLSLLGLAALGFLGRRRNH